MDNLNDHSARKKWLITAVFAAIGFVAIQFIHPDITNPPVTADIQAPANVKAILKRACYDCHSNETNLRWYDKIAPVYWGVAEHVKDGRAGLNFSYWQQMAPPDQKAKLWEAVNQVIAGAMPIKNYQAVHPETKISAADLAVLKTYVNGMAAKVKPGDIAKINAADQQYRQWPNGKATANELPVALNGIAYDPGYKNWQAVSTTNRFDNGTLRVIFGNDIAIKAIKENHIHPWPNGTKFAKVAWDQLADTAGNVKTGAFRQIEYMIRDDEKYAATKGWGFARFRTMKLTPYGKTAMFTTECVNCHRPLKDEDFVFTQPIKH